MRAIDFQSAVLSADNALGGNLATPAIKAWARLTFGPPWREHMAARTVCTGLHILAQWRRNCPRANPDFLTYARHRVWALEGVTGVIDPDAHAALRVILGPRPAQLRLSRLSAEWRGEAAGSSL